jgi:hypothetical protein
MIRIRRSPTADTRTCDWWTVSQDTLLRSSLQHIGDVAQALGLFASMIAQAAARHDYDKISDIEWFHQDFATGFAQTGWWENHRKVNRHHLTQADGVPADVNLVDVLDFVADSVMAGLARSGSVYALELPSEVLQLALQNTAELLKAATQVSEEPNP